jgi:WS/DGAT/MGAT family acyltransferase
MDRLSALDASFLHREQRSAHMHVGVVTVFEGPPPSYAEYREHIQSKLTMLPRYRQKLAFPRFEMGHPFWVDDPDFSLEYHVRHTALRSPGTVAELRELIGRLFSQRLDRSRPLWENWLVEGLEGGRWAIIAKAHHALVDGVGGVDLMQVVFDLSPVPDYPSEPVSWEPHREPSDVALVAEGVFGAARTPLELAGRAVNATLRPRRTLAWAAERLEGVGELAWARVNPAPQTPLNVEVGPHRRTWWVSSRLEDFKAIKNALGGTVNDAVLAVVSGALARWLRSRGVRTEGLELQALVPVSIRGPEGAGALGNQIAAMRGALPVYIDDPVERLRVVSQQMGDLKASKQALGAEVLSGLTDYGPPTVLALASRLNFSTKLFNLIVTNVPGPQMPLYVLGRELEELIPVAFLPEHHALAVAIISYHGKVEFGLLADFDAVPDLENLADYLAQALAELLEVATGDSPGDPGGFTASDSSAPSRA